MARESRFLNRGENTLLSQQSLLLRMELRSNPAMLSVVRGAVVRLTERLGGAEPECRAVVRAVDEALTNIIRHHGQMGRPIEASRRIRYAGRIASVKDSRHLLIPVSEICRVMAEGPALRMTT